jgi:hypothetical protein
MKTLRQIARKGCLETLIGLLRSHDLPPQGTVPAQCAAAMQEFTGLSERASRGSKSHLQHSAAWRRGQGHGIISK